MQITCKFYCSNFHKILLLLQLFYEIAQKPLSGFSLITNSQGVEAAALGLDVAVEGL